MLHSEDDIRKANERGWHFLRCAQGTKRPIDSGWGKGKPPPDIPTEELIRHVEQGGNLALLTGPQSGVLVLDVDPRNGGELPSNLPAKVTAKTGGGGWHLYFNWPDSMTEAKINKTLINGVDIKGDGGLVIFPGSTHPNGQPYEWLPGDLPPMMTP